MTAKTARRERDAAKVTKYVRAPIDHYTQEQARERRQAGWSVQYGADWSLVAEVRDQVAPLAAQMCELLRSRWVIDPRGEQRRLVFRTEVEAVAESVQRLRVKAAELLAADRLPADARARVAAVVASPEHRNPVVFTDDELRGGSWVGRLVEQVAPLDADLSALLGRSTAPQGVESGASSSLRFDVLGGGVVVGGGSNFDYRVRQLAQRIPAVRRAQAACDAMQTAAAEADWRREQERVADELRRLKLGAGA